jgi:hypothetical protein
MTRDPIGEKGGHNLYTYVRNNVTNRKDPSGLLGAKAPAGILAKLPLAFWIAAKRCSKGLIEAYKAVTTSTGAMAHCVTACKLTKACGSLISDLAGIYKEWLVDMPGYFFYGGLGISADELSDTLDDLDDNESGRSCADDCRGCEECCKFANLQGT